MLDSPVHDGVHVGVRGDPGDLQQHVGGSRARSARGPLTQLENLTSLLKEAHPPQIACDVSALGKLQPRPAALLLPRHSPGNQEGHHAVGVHPTEVPGVEQRPPGIEARNLVEEPVQRLLVQGAGD
jgi:hypothetical protein